MIRLPIAILSCLVCVSCSNTQQLDCEEQIKETRMLADHSDELVHILQNKLNDLQKIYQSVEDENKSLKSR